MEGNKKYDATLSNLQFLCIFGFVFWVVVFSTGKLDPSIKLLLFINIYNCFLRSFSFSNYWTVSLRYILQELLNNFCSIVVSRPMQPPHIRPKTTLTSEKTGRNTWGEHDFNFLTSFLDQLFFNCFLFPNIVEVFVRQLLNSSDICLSCLTMTFWLMGSTVLKILYSHFRKVVFRVP